jgi:hypothetical protein
LVAGDSTARPYVHAILLQFGLLLPCEAYVPGRAEPTCVGRGVGVGVAWCHFDLPCTASQSPTGEQDVAKDVNEKQVSLELSACALLRFEEDYSRSSTLTCDG